MSVGSVLIALQAFRRDGRGVTAAEFLTPLAIRPGEVTATRADGGEWAAGLIHFAIVRMTDIDTSADADAPSEAFHAATIDACRAAGQFLDRRPPAVTAAMRAAGLSLRLLVEVRMNHDQMELELPPELLAACGRHGLSVYVISNDIPADEVMTTLRSESPQSSLFP